MAEQGYNYLFVSDFHIAMGADPDHKIFNPREDFYYDDEFARFLRWADASREGKLPWELVFVGDCFDFLPVELAWMRQYEAAVDQLLGTLTAARPEDVKPAWESLFYEAELPRTLQLDLLDTFLQHGLVTVEPRDLAELAARNREQFGRYDVELDELAAPEEGFGSDGLADESYAGFYDPCEEDPFARDADTFGREPAAWREAEAPDAVRLPRWVEAYLEGRDAAPSGRPRLPQERARSGLFLVFKPAAGLGQVGRWLHRLRLWLRRRRTYRIYQFDHFFGQEASVQKLCTIYRGHRTFFEALAWWVGRGHRLVVLAGNHDLEICWPEVQRKFKEILVYNYLNATDQDEESGGGEEEPRQPDMAAFRERIDFSRQWFYYQPGAFYAEHGNQYDNINATVNHLAPYWHRQTPEGTERLLHPSFGSVGNPIVARLEDSFPAWENVGSHGSTLSYLIREYPWRFARILSRNLWQYADLIGTLLRGTRGTAGEQGPTEEQFDAYHALSGHERLPRDFLKTLYYSWDQPLMRYRTLAQIVTAVMRVLALPLGLVYWLLELLKVFLSPRGFLLFVLLFVIGILALPESFAGIQELVERIGGWAAQIENVVKLVGSAVAAVVLGILISGIKDTLIAFLRGKDEKRFQAALFGTDYIRAAGRQTFQLFEERANDSQLRPFPLQDLPRYYIFGHDHDACRILLKEADYWSGAKSTYYLNTGSWLSLFAAEDARRLRTGGSDLEFTFVKIWRPVDGYGEGEYQASLLRWDDAAGRAEDQIVITPLEETDTIEKALEGTILSTAGLGAALGLALGLWLGRWGSWAILGTAGGGLLGWLLQKGASRRS
jgi:hypothetical protein